jgi:hypothetical protein
MLKSRIFVFSVLAVLFLTVCQNKRGGTKALDVAGALEDSLPGTSGVELYWYTGEIKRCSDRVNLRERPSLDAGVIAVLDAGRLVEIEARTISMEKIDGMDDYWYYFFYALDDAYNPAHGYVFGGYLEDPAVPEEVNLPEVLSGINVPNITEDDIKTIEKRLIGNNEGPTAGGGFIKHIDRGSRYRDRYYTGLLRLYTVEGMTIAVFERFLGDQLSNNAYTTFRAIEKVIVYPHENPILFAQQVFVWPGSKKEDVSVWGLYTHPQDEDIFFEVWYYPQAVIIVDNRTGEMRLESNKDNKYSFFTGE